MTRKQSKKCQQLLVNRQHEGVGGVLEAHVSYTNTVGTKTAWCPLLTHTDDYQIKWLESMWVGTMVKQLNNLITNSTKYFTTWLSVCRAFGTYW